MKHFYNTAIKKLVLLLYVICLFLLPSCTGNKSEKQPSNVPSAEASKQPNNTWNSYTSLTCPICGGSGVCPICQGEGHFVLPEDGLTECPECHGSGICFECNGTGSMPSDQ